MLSLFRCQYLEVSNNRATRREAFLKDQQATLHENSWALHNSREYKMAHKDQVRSQKPGQANVTLEAFTPVWTFRRLKLFPPRRRPSLKIKTTQRSMDLTFTGTLQHTFSPSLTQYASFLWSRTSRRRSLTRLWSKALLRLLIPQTATWSTLALTSPIW